METRDLASTPTIPLPNPGEGGPVYSGDEGQVPVIPLPNPGEGGPVYSGTTPPAIQPLPDYYFPGNTSLVRFLNATRGYPSFRILIDGQRAVSLLPPSTVSGYVRVAPGRHTITVQGQDGYTYLEQTVRFTARTPLTLVVNNRTGGLRLSLLHGNL